MKPTDVEVVVLDLGGVLIELAGIETMLEWCPHVDGCDDLWRRWLYSPAVRAYESGRTTTAEFGEAVVAEFGLPVPAGDFLALFEKWPRRLFPGTHELLGEIAARYRLASASNTNEMHWELFISEFSLPQRFDHNFPSCRVGKLKPDADYFVHILEQVNARPSRVVFVDDNPINVEAARNCGLSAHLARGASGLRSTLVALGLLE